MTAPTHIARPGLGIVMMLGAWAMFAVTDTSVKWLVLAGVGAVQLAFARYGVQLLLSLATGGRIWTPVTGRQMRLLTLRAGLLLSATVLNFYALQFLSLTVTAAIMFSSPIIVAVLAVPMLGERIGPWRWFAVALGFVGVLCVVRPFGADFHWTTLLIVYNATALALFSIITRKLAGEIAPQVMQIYMGVLGTAVLLPFALWTWGPVGDPLNWVLFFTLGAAAWAGHEVFARAHAHAEASLLMPFSYSFLIYLAASSWVVFNEVPDAMTLLGAGIIVTAGLIIWWRENQRPTKDTN